MVCVKTHLSIYLFIYLYGCLFVVLYFSWTHVMIRIGIEYCSHGIFSPWITRSPMGKTWRTIIIGRSQGSWISVIYFNFNFFLTWTFACVLMVWHPPQLHVHLSSAFYPASSISFHNWLCLLSGLDQSYCKQVWQVTSTACDTIPSSAWCCSHSKINYSSTY